MDTVLKTVDLQKVYKRKAVVNNVNLNVERGSIYGLIGKNGAGKTTIMKMITGLAGQTSGTIELFGSDNLLVQRKKIGCVIENPSLYESFTGYQNLVYYNKLLGNKNNDNIAPLLEMVGLDPNDKKKTKKYSLGMKQRLAIAIALIGNPEFLVLDEPINGLDPTGIIEIRDIILKLQRERNITILISSHILGELDKIATHYGIINNGELIQEFSKEELKNINKQYIEIKVTPTEEASQILSQALNIDNINVTDDEIHLPHDICEKSEISRILATNNIFVDSITTKGQDLEEYFVSLLGGNA